MFKDMTKCMILADENIAAFLPLFASLGTCETYAGRLPPAEQLARAQVLLVRSTTKVNTELLVQAPQLAFVGTATIGEEHIDKNALHAKGIVFARAAGCNAQAVLEYVMITFHRWMQTHDFSIKSPLTVGVVGCGNVGEKVVNAFARLGFSVWVVDPFEQKKNHDKLPPQARWADLDELAQADIVSLHTPLTREHNSEHPTHHLIDTEWLRVFKGKLLINTGRGAVIDTAALLAQFKASVFTADVVLDVWENEPTPCAELVQHVWQATPHIAGYTLEGKIRGSFMLYEQLLKASVAHLPSHPQDEQSQDKQPQDEQRPKQLSDVLPAVSDVHKLTSLAHLFAHVYQPAVDDRALRDVVRDAGDVSDEKANAQLASGFDGLRKNYRLRRELEFVLANALSGVKSSKTAGEKAAALIAVLGEDAQWLYALGLMTESDYAVAKTPINNTADHV